MIAIAIDGPSGAGKSSLARKAAERLGYIYVDTGALYRAVALYVMEQGADPEDVQAVCACLPQVQITIGYVNGVQHVYLNGSDVSEQIRVPALSQIVSKVAALPAVRAFLLGMQRDLARENNVIMDGRDIGMVVLPEAQVKIFLTALAEERARRRHLEYVEKGVKIDYNKVLEDMQERDRRDAPRILRAPDAVLLDTTELDFAQSLDRLVEIIEQRVGK